MAAIQQALSELRSKLRVNEVETGETESKFAAADRKLSDLPPGSGNVEADYAHVVECQQQAAEQKANAGRRLEVLRSERESLESQRRSLMTELASLKAEALAA